MLLLSSATSIFGTERPPGCTPILPFTIETLLEQTVLGASISTPPLVSEVDITNFFYEPVPKDKGCDAFRTPCPVFRFVDSSYQGMIFFSPFFLLLDSFVFFESAGAFASAGFAVAPAVESVAGALVFEPSVVVVAVAGESVEPA